MNIQCPLAFGIYPLVYFGMSQPVYILGAGRTEVEGDESGQGGRDAARAREHDA